MLYNARHFFELIRLISDMNALYKTQNNKTQNKTLSKTIVSALTLFTISAFPVAAMASDADEIQQRVKKVGKLNVGEAAAPTAAAAPVESAGESAAPATVNSADLYQANCFACHGTGAAGAPILGNKEAWAPRIAQGEATLVEHSINGFNAMPPRGGTTLKDEELKAVVTYMIESSQ